MTLTPKQEWEYSVFGCIEIAKVDISSFIQQLENANHIVNSFDAFITYDLQNGLEFHGFVEWTDTYEQSEKDKYWEHVKLNDKFPFPVPVLNEEKIEEIKQGLLEHRTAMVRSVMKIQ